MFRFAVSVFRALSRVVLTAALALLSSSAPLSSSLSASALDGARR